jgi:hypothetical protein
MRTDRLTDLTKRMVEFPSCTNAPNKSYGRYVVVRKVITELPYRRVKSQKIGFIMTLKENNL